ncbi:SEC-C metal-binding domain-containing protein [Kribbella sp. WER1]
MIDLLADEIRDPQTEAQFGRCVALRIAASDHVRHQRHERAVAIWRQLIREGGEDGDQAHVDYAEFLFGEGRDDEARAELAAVQEKRRIHGTAWASAAELLEERGEDAEALPWYSAATDALTVEDVFRDDHLQELVTGRRRVRWALQLPLDEIDLLGYQGTDEALDREAAQRALLRDPVVVDGQLQVWDRSEFDAGVPWRNHFVGTDPDAYCLAAERALRVEDRPVTIATWTYAGFLDSLEDEEAQILSVPDGRRVSWPPARNERCWCGSGTKYKKCCGGPLPAVEALPPPEESTG